MPKKISPEDLSINELRRLLVEKRRRIRQERLQHFRRTGRVVMLVPDGDTASLENMHSSDAEESVEGPAAKPSRSRRVVDTILLLVEISAVIGLLFILFNGLEVIRNLNQQVAQSLVQPTLTPTPLIVAVVLPGGHTPPNSPGGAQPNDSEIPEHLRPLVQSLANVPIPTAGPEQGIRIQIPVLNPPVDAPIVQGDNWEQLKKGVGQHIGTTNPGQPGNMVLTAHNDVFGEIFRDLDKLKPGDKIIILTAQHSYIYIVTGSKIVEKNQVDVMNPTQDATVTLISCYPYMIDNKRIIVTGTLQSGSR